MTPASNPKIPKTILAGIILSIFFFFGIGVLSFFSIVREQDSAIWVEQSYEAVSALQKVPADLRAIARVRKPSGKGDKESAPC